MEDIRCLIKAARRKARSVGPLHALWDVIADAEALLDGRKTLLPADEILDLLRRETTPPDLPEDR